MKRSLNLRMPLQFTSEPLAAVLDSTNDGQGTTLICLFPSVVSKEEHRSEVDLKAVYEKYPETNYYIQHSSTDKGRALPGDCKVYPFDNVSVANMFIHMYPGCKTYPNDNHVLRVKWFTTALKTLEQTYGLSTVHMALLPGCSETEKRDYIAAVEDFISNYKLAHSISPIVYLHGESPIEKQAIKVKPKAVTAKTVSKPTSAQAIKVVATPKATTYKLEFTPEQVCSSVLFEIDFVRTEASVEEPMDAPQGIMQYFPPGWNNIVGDKLLQEKAAQVTKDLAKLGDHVGDAGIYPAAEDLFSAFRYSTNPKVIILGQDPYHGPGQAHGMSFSVQPGVSIPPSLLNIFKAIKNDAGVPGFTMPKHGNLVAWAKQGVILLNTALTVKQGKPKSHVTEWAAFTDRLLKLLSTSYKGLIFVLWGGEAQKKKTHIAGSGHVILEFNHPSPAYPNNTFATECKHFSEINGHLKKMGKTPIDWSL